MADTLTPAAAVNRLGWWTIDQTMAQAQVSRRTIYNWLALGKLDYARTAGGSIRIDPASVFRSSRRPVRDGSSAEPGW